MPVAPGTTLGPYQIVASIGVGGMGEVYKARDTRLGRDVAIKVLPEDWADDAERRARFEREARTVSTLNHPNICTLHDIGFHSGLHFLVMELIDGETLAQRLERGPVPLEQALRYAAYVADALDKAHRKGIVHRDLKPQNIMISKTGVKLLDFGIARQTLEEGTGNTLTLTSDGFIAGTVPYMAPEQLEGKPADHRADIFAFGAVLYETLTGKPAFGGSSRASTIAAILMREPPSLMTASPSIPPGVDRIVAKCLAKDPDLRWQSAADLRDVLRLLTAEPVSGATPVAAPAPPRKFPWFWVAACAVLAAIAAASWMIPRQPRREAAQLAILAPEGSEINAFGAAISPDGRSVAFVATTRGARNLWLRPLDSDRSQRLEGTDNAMFPFWSPDGGSIGFFAHNKLMRVDLGTRAVRTIATAGLGRGGTWGPNGEIVFAPSLSAPLLRVAAAGGQPAPATGFNAARRDTRHNFPQMLPGGNRFLVFVRSSDPDQTGTYAGTLDDPQKLEPVRGALGVVSQAVHARAADGADYLLFVRDRMLYAQRFDLDNLRLEGAPMAIAPREMSASSATPGFLNITASANGTLLDGGARQPPNRLALWDRQGKLIDMVTPDGEYMTPKLSPDGTRVVVSRVDSANGEISLWLYDLVRRSNTRLTFTRGMSFYAVWSPDGQRIAYATDRQGNPSIFVQPANGMGEGMALFASGGSNRYPHSWSRDGNYIAYTEIRSGSDDRGDISISPVDRPDAAVSYLSTKAGELHPQFSPDAGEPRWILYTSDESGDDQVYIRPFRLGPAPEAKWQVSVNGGRYGRWNADGTEVFFLAPDARMMSVKVRLTAAGVETQAPQALFETRLAQPVWLRYEYDVTPDGQRFLLLNPAEERPGSAVNVLLNWDRLAGR